MKNNIALIIVLFFFSFLLSEETNESYFVEEYVLRWEYDQIGDIEIIIEQNDINSSINLCSSSTTCVVLAAKDAKLLSDQLNNVNDFYSRFKTTEGDLTEEIVVVEDKLELEYSKDITNGFRIKIYDQKTYDSVYLSRKEATKLSNLLSNSDKLVKFLKDKINSCLD